MNLLGLRNYSFDTIIDIGANVGQFAQKIIKVYPNAQIYCFEPLPEPFAELSKWAETTKGKVTPVNLAIGDEDNDRVSIFLHEDHNSSSSLLATTKVVEELYPKTKKQRNITVKQKTLDSALNSMDLKLSKSILIKLDVQGYEDRVISGGSNVFNKISACILEISLDSLYEGQADFQILYSMLVKNGFSYRGNIDQAYAKDGHCIYIDALFMRDKNR